MPVIRGARDVRFPGGSTQIHIHYYDRTQHLRIIINMILPNLFVTEGTKKKGGGRLPTPTTIKREIIITSEQHNNNMMKKKKNKK